MEVLGFCGDTATRVVPINIPTLADVKTLHFFQKDSVKCKVVLFLHKMTNPVHWCDVHEVSCVDCHINSKLLVTTKVASSHVASIFDIVNHKRSVVHNFGETTCKVYVFVLFIL